MTMPKLAIIGLGNMGEALLSGMLSKGVTSPSQVIGVEMVPERLAEIAAKYGIATSTDVGAAAREAQMVLVAVKPKDAEGVVSQIPEGKLVVSICAGLTIHWFEKHLPKETGVVRVMPNTPALVGEGAAGFASNRYVTQEGEGYVRGMLGAVGRCVKVEDEKLLDAVTGLSGSGPAYVLLMIEAMADGGVAAGLPRQLAIELAAQTVLGTAAMALSGVAHTAELKDRVCSPGGTTIEGVRRLEAGGFRSAVIEAVVAASKKSKELGG